MSDGLPMYVYDKEMGEYVEIKRPPAAIKVKLKEVKYPLGVTGKFYTETIAAEYGVRKNGKVIREFDALIY